MRTFTHAPKLLAFAFFFAAVEGCNRSTHTDIASEPASTSSPSAISSEVPPAPHASALASEAPSATPAPSASVSKPTEEVVQQSGDPWPFKAWDRAESVTFNRGINGPNFVRLFRYHAYGPKGWSPTMANRKRLTKAQSLKAMELVVATEGDVRVTSCPEPEHAVIFFNGNSPVGSVNVSFACGDILLWPEWTPHASLSLHSSDMTEKELEDETGRRERQRLVYAKTLEAWKTYFRGFGHSIETPPHGPLE